MDLAYLLGPGMVGYVVPIGIIILLLKQIPRYTYTDLASTGPTVDKLEASTYSAAAIHQW